MSLSVLLTFANVKGYTAWQSVGASLYDAEFNRTNIAEDLGIPGASDTQWYSALAKMLTAIAYSAAPSSSPFGTTAATSYFNDADTLGQIQNNNDFTGTLAPISSGLLAPSPVDSLAEILVQYAGDQAWTAGQNGGSDGVASSSGAFTLSGSGSALKVDLSPVDWSTTYTSGQKKIQGVSDLVSGVLYNVLSIDPGTTVGGVRADNVIDKFVAQKYPSEIDIALSSGATLDSTGAASSYNSATANTILVGQNNDGTITAGDGDNLVFGGQTVSVGNGSNIIVGESGGQTITVGGGDNVVIGAGQGDTINIEGDQPNNDPTSNAPNGINFVYAGDGGTVNFDGTGQMGFIILPAVNFSPNALLDLDQQSLTATLDGWLSNTNWTEYEANNTNGMTDFDWTVILAPVGSAAGTIDVNGAPIDSIIGPGYPDPGPAYQIINPWSVEPGSGLGNVFTIDKGALFIDDEMPSVGGLSLTQYLIPDSDNTKGHSG